MGYPIVHFEIHVPDEQVGAKFYSELLGWKTQAAPEMNYVLVENTGTIGGGIGREEKGAWSTVYVGAPDIQALLDKAEKLGGTTVMPVTEIPNVVTFAMFTDLDGNVMGLVKTDSDMPPQEAAGAQMGWFEIYSKDPRKAWAFYRELFGWDIHESEGDGFVYGEIHTDGPVGGGISSTNSGELGVVLWASVDDQEAYLKRVVELGGQRVMDPTPVNEGLVVSSFKDPQGAKFGLFTFKGAS